MSRPVRQPFRDPNLPPLPKPDTKETPMKTLCKCGIRSWAHYPVCECGEVKP